MAITLRHMDDGVRLADGADDDGRGVDRAAALRSAAGQHDHRLRWRGRGRRVDVEGEGVVGRDVVEAVRRLYSGEQLLSPQEVMESLRLVFREREKNRGGQAFLGNAPVIDGLRDCPTVRGYALRHCGKASPKEPLVARRSHTVLELP